MSSLPTFFWPKRVTWLAMMNFKKERKCKSTVFLD